MRMWTNKWKFECNTFLVLPNLNEKESKHDGLGLAIEKILYKNSTDIVPINLFNMLSPELKTLQGNEKFIIKQIEDWIAQKNCKKVSRRVNADLEPSWES